MNDIVNNNIIDNSLQARTVMVNNNVQQYSSIPAEECATSVRFNSTQGTLRLRNFTDAITFGTTDFTIETFINRDSFDEEDKETGDTFGSVVASFNNDTNRLFYIRAKFVRGNNFFKKQTNIALYYGTELIISGTLDDCLPGKWLHIAITRYDNVNFLLHINGRLTSTSKKNTYIICNTPLFIGSLPDVEIPTGYTGPRPFIGNISGLRISNISRYSESDFTPSRQQLVKDERTTLLCFQKNALTNEAQLNDEYFELVSNLTPVVYNGTPILKPDIEITETTPYVNTLTYTNLLSGGSLQFNDDSYLIFNETATTGVENWTVSFWVKPTAFYRNKKQTLFTTRAEVENLTPGITVSLLSDNIPTMYQKYIVVEMYELYNRKSFYRMYPIPDNSVYNTMWSHVNIVFKSEVENPEQTNGTLMIYLNGKPLGLPELSFDISADFSNITLGAIFNGDGYVNNFSGNISRFTITKTPLKGNQFLEDNNTDWLEPFKPPYSIADVNENTLILLKCNNINAFDRTQKNKITIHGNISESTPGRFSASSYFLNGNSFMQITPHNINETIFYNDFTIECWLRWHSILHTTSPGVFQFSVAPIGLSQNYNTGIALFTSAPSNNYTLSVSTKNNLSNTFIEIPSSTPLLNIWQHIAVTRHNGTLYFFLDGIQKHVTDNTLEHPILASSFCIGGHYDATKLFKGDIENFRVTNGIARYISSFNPPQQSF